MYTYQQEAGLQQLVILDPLDAIILCTALESIVCTLPTYCDYGF